MVRRPRIARTLQARFVKERGALSLTCFKSAARRHNYAFFPCAPRCARLGARSVRRDRRLQRRASASGVTATLPDRIRACRILDRAEQETRADMFRARRPVDNPVPGIFPRSRTALVADKQESLRPHLLLHLLVWGTPRRANSMG